MSVKIIFMNFFIFLNIFGVLMCPKCPVFYLELLVSAEDSIPKVRKQYLEPTEELPHIDSYEIPENTEEDFKKQEKSQGYKGKSKLKAQTMHPYISTVQTYFFEGVDYDFTNDAYLKEHNDCFGEFMRCIRSRVTFEGVCALDTVGWYLEDFDNICQLELYNCRYRVYGLRQGVFGVNMASNRFYYNGFKIDCAVYISTRRREEAIKEYLGDEFEEMLAYRNKMMRLGYFKDTKRIIKDL